jgi:DNA-binding MarR family transcriptional regulator
VPVKESVAVRMRAFNRFYTERIGALDERHEGLALTIAESRCLFTVRRLGEPDVGAIADALGLDLGYVSRLVSRLERNGRVRRTSAEDDRRRRVVTLTAAGEDLLGEVERRSNARMCALVAHLKPRERRELLIAMDAIRRLLERDDGR